MRSFLLLTMLFLSALIGPSPAAAQDDSLDPWILVVPAANRTGDTGLAPIGTTVADTIELTLRLLGDWELRSIPAERIPPEVIAGDTAAIERFATAETIDYVVFGEISTRGETIAVRASVWDRRSGEVTVEEEGVAETLFDTFDVADELTQRFLSAFSGQRIAFGQIRVEREGWQQGEYDLYIDGAPAGSNVGSVGSVLVGDRRVEVVAANGPAAGETIFSAPVFVREGAVSTVRFSMVPPGEEEADSAGEPDAPEANVADADAGDADAATEEPEPPEPADPSESIEEPEASLESEEPESTPDPIPSPEEEPWSRGTRSAQSGSPFYSFGISYLRWNNDLRDNGSATPAVSLWADLDWEDRLRFGFLLQRAPEPAVEYVDSATGAEALAANAYTPVPEAANLGVLSLGWSFAETSGGEWQVDYAVSIPFGYKRQFYYLELDDGRSIDAAFSGGAGDWVHQDYLIGGIDLSVRGHWRHLTLKTSFRLTANEAIGDIANNRWLTIYSSSTGDYVETGEVLSGMVESGLTGVFELGVGYSFGGRP